MEDYTKKGFTGSKTTSKVQDEPVYKLDKQWNSKNVDNGIVGLLGSVSIANEDDVMEEDFTLYTKNLRANALIYNKTVTTLNLTDTTFTLDLNLNNLYTLILKNDVTLTLTNSKPTIYTFIIIQNGGPFILTLDVSIKYPNSTPFTVTETAGATDMIQILSVGDGSYYLINENKNYG